MDSAGQGSVFEPKTKVFPEVFPTKVTFTDGDLEHLPGAYPQKHSVMKEFG